MLKTETENKNGVFLKLTKQRFESKSEVSVQAYAAVQYSTSDCSLQVRCLHFSSTYIANTMGVSPTLWAGTNTGQVCWCQICIS